MSEFSEVAERKKRSKKLTSPELEKSSIFDNICPQLLSRVKLVHVFGHQKTTRLFVTTDDEVYSVGDSQFGCFGIGSESPPHSSTPVIVEALCGKKVSNFSFCSSHQDAKCFALTTPGLVYAWGYNTNGDLGLGTTINTFVPTLVEGLRDKRVVQLSCGWGHPLVLTSEGEVFSWGFNGHGQVGNGTTQNQTTPLKVSDGIGEISKVSCGYYHSIALSKNGQVFSWGSNCFGQLGIGTKTSAMRPVQVIVPNNDKIDKIACGMHHTIALAMNGTLYTWGWNSNGQLGNGSIKNNSTPTEVHGLDRVVDIASINYLSSLSICATESKVYVWGNVYGKLITRPMETDMTSIQDALYFYSKPQDVMYKTLVCDPDQISPSEEHDMDKVLDFHCQQQPSATEDTIEFIQVLGSGAFGIVFEAVRGNESPCAIKIIFPECVNDTTQEKVRLLREVRNVADKRHQNIVRTITFWEKTVVDVEIDMMFDDIKLQGKVQEKMAQYRTRATRLGGLDTIWIQMELCGHTLRSWLNLNKNTTVDLTLAEFQVSIVKGLIDGLTYLHKYKISHRDFKPENIYFSQDYSLPVKIGDFGLSRELLEENSKTNALTSRVGTLDYMAPETNTRHYSLQADLFSMGLVIWEVLQLIGSNERKSLFDELVYDKRELLIEPHPVVRNCVEVISNLTKRNVDERAKTIDHIELIINVNTVKVDSSEELHQRLEVAYDGEIIELEGGQYQGLFHIKRDYICIIGKGDGTTLSNISNTKSGPTSVLRITGKYCKVINIKVLSSNELSQAGITVEGSDNKIQDVKFQGGFPSLKVTGHKNRLSNLAIKNAYNGVWIYRGNENELNSVQAHEITRTAIDIYGNANKVDTVNCRNVNRGVHIEGDSNNLMSTDCYNAIDWNDKIIQKSRGVFIKGGTENVIEKLKCSGLFEYDLYLNHGSRVSTISNSSCDGVIRIHGSAQRLVNVHGGKEISIRGKDHRFESCTAQSFVHEDVSLELIRCNNI